MLIQLVAPSRGFMVVLAPYSTPPCFNYKPNFSSGRNYSSFAPAASRLEFNVNVAGPCNNEKGRYHYETHIKLVASLEYYYWGIN